MMSPRSLYSALISPDAGVPTSVGSVGYDDRGQISNLIVSSGITTDYTYDDLGRLTDKAVAPGTGVAGTTTFAAFAYDGLSRIVRAENDLEIVVVRAPEELPAPATRWEDYIATLESGLPDVDIDTDHDDCARIVHRRSDRRGRRADRRARIPDAHR